MKLLEGKTALITGASKGIGRTIATRFAEEGANVAFTYLSSVEKGQALEKELQQFGTQVKGYRSDDSDDAAAAALGPSIAEDFGTTDIVVNKAGIANDGRLLRDRRSVRSGKESVRTCRHRGAGHTRALNTR